MEAGIGLDSWASGLPVRGCGDPVGISQRGVAAQGAGAWSRVWGGVVARCQLVKPGSLGLLSFGPGRGAGGTTGVAPMGLWGGSAVISVGVSG